MTMMIVIVILVKNSANILANAAKSVTLFFSPKNNSGNLFRVKGDQKYTRLEFFLISKLDAFIFNIIQEGFKFGFLVAPRMNLERLPSGVTARPRVS